MRRWIAMLSVVLIVGIAAGVGLISAPEHRPVSDRQAAVALSVALEKIGTPYVWASRGPDTFDSSGIIVYAYRQAIPHIEFRVGNGPLPRYAADANHRDFFNWNFEPRAVSEMRPGDLVYITTGDEQVTHGMMFVEQLDANTIRVLDASSRLMEVAMQDWPIDEEVRGQRLVAMGRLSIKERDFAYRHDEEAP